MCSSKYIYLYIYVKFINNDYHCYLNRFLKFSFGNYAINVLYFYLSE